MMMTDKYVDGFVLPVPAKNIDAYKQFSARRELERARRS